MNFLHNIRIKSKLIFLTGIMFVFISVVSAVGLYSVKELSKELDWSINKINKCLIELSKANYAYGQMMLQTRDLTVIGQQGGVFDATSGASAQEASVTTVASSEESGATTDVNAVTAASSNESGWGDQKTYAEVNMQEYINAINNYAKLAKENNITSGKGYDIMQTLIKRNSEVLPMIQSCIDMARVGNVVDASGYMVNVIKPRASELSDLMLQLTQINNEQSEATKASADKTKQHAILFIIITLVAGFAIVIPVVIIIIRVIEKPLRRMSQKMALIADGNIDVQIAENSKDEVGILSANISRVLDILHSLITGMENMASGQANGDTDAFIDTEKYNGSYKSVALGVNKMVSLSLDEMQEVLRTLTGISHGDFNYTIKSFPGKKNEINIAVESFRVNLKSVYKEIEELVQGAVDGKLSERADSSRYMGDWAELINKLNELFEAIVTPINEASEVLAIMSDGNFDVNIKGEYKGDMEKIKISVNNMIDSISLYIKEITSVLNEIANNNLQTGISRKYVGQFDNIKTSVNTIITNLSQVLGTIATASVEVSSGAENLSQGSLMLANGATEQSVTVQNLSLAIESISEKVINTANSAKSADNLSAKSKEIADSAVKEVRQMLVSMDEIKESSIAISKIVKAIEDIAFQTSLLALNAAIEAARAGEAGKGFAVVAEQVKLLSSHSQELVNNTTELVTNAIAKVEHGVENADNTSSAIYEIANNVQETSSQIRNISKATTEQTSDLVSIKDGLSQISEVVKSNSSMSEEISASSELLSGQSEMLKNMMWLFKIKETHRKT